MKVGSVCKSSNVSFQAKFKCNREALEQLGKKKVLELEKTCKKIGNPNDIILVGSKSIYSKSISQTNNDFEKVYTNAISYHLKRETGLAFLQNTTDIISNNTSQGLSNLSRYINEFIKRF